MPSLIERVMVSTPPMAETATDTGARMKPTTVASAVHRVQMALYDGAAASREPLLRAAASLLGWSICRISP